MLVLVVTLAVPSPAATIECGSVVVEDTTLDADLADCPHVGLFIGADDITIDLNGHTIRGSGEPQVCLDDPPPPPPPPPDCEEGTEGCEGGGEIPCDHLDDTIGIDNRAGYDGIVVTNGAILLFEFAVRMDGSDGSALINLDVEGLFCDHAVTFTDSDDNTVTGVTITSGLGIAMAGDDNVIEDNVLRPGCVHPEIVVSGARNRVNNNDLRFCSIRVEGVENAVSGNQIDRTEVEPGITVRGDDNVITGNGLVGAGFDPITPGILVIGTDEGGSSDGNRILSNAVRSGAGDGILVDATATGTVIERNRVLANGEDGIDVKDANATVAANVAIRNTELGIEAAAGVIDGGRNVAHANGDPQQCSNIDCR